MTKNTVHVNFDIFNRSFYLLDTGWSEPYLMRNKFQTSEMFVLFLTRSMGNCLIIQIGFKAETRKLTNGVSRKCGLGSQTDELESKNEVKSIFRHFRHTGLYYLICCLPPLTLLFPETKYF